MSMEEKKDGNQDGVQTKRNKKWLDTENQLKTEEEEIQDTF